MSTRSNSIAVNIASLLTIQAANFVLPLILLPFLARTLGISQFGLLSFTQAFIMYFALATEYGFDLSASRAIASNREDRSRVTVIFWSTMTARLLIGIASIATIVAIVSLIPSFRADFAVYMCGSITLLSSVMTPMWYFQGMEILKNLAVSQLVVRGLTTVSIFFLVTGPLDVALVLTIQGIGSIVAALVSWFLIMRLAPLGEFSLSWKEILTRYKEGWHVFLSSAAISLYTTSNVFILGLISTNTQVGYFSLAEKLARAASGFLGPICQAVYPRIASVTARSISESISLLRRTLRGLTVVGTFTSIVLLLAPELLIHLFAGEASSSASASLQVLSALPLLVAISSVFGTLAMLNFGLDKQFSRTVLSLGLVNIAGLVLASSALQAVGAAIALVATEVLVTFTLAIILHRHGYLLPILRNTGKDLTTARPSRSTASK